jgi:hypothetical protein
MKFTISEKSALYTLFIVQSLLALCLYYVMLPATQTGFAAMVMENEAYEFGVQMNSLLISIVLGLILILLFQVIMFMFWRWVFKVIDTIAWGRQRVIPRRKRRSAESL